jgi:opacity protein-like surface antigen
MKKTLKIKKYLAAAVVFLMLPMAVFAESAGVGNKLFSIGPRATYSTPKDADQGTWNPGAQLRIHMSPVLGLEGSIDYRSNNYLNLTTIKTYPVQANLLVYLVPGAVVSPFLLGGGGWYYTQVDGPFGFSHTYSRFSTQLGAGLEIMLNEGLSLDGTYRQIWLESVASKDANALDKTYEDSGSMITIGLNLLF